MRIHALRTPLHAARRGFTLIECLVYVSVLAVVLGVAFTAFYRCWDNSMGVRRNAEDIERTLKAGERWRADVRSATGPLVVEKTDQEQVLHIPQAGGEILYLFSLGEVQRRASPDASWVQLLPKVTSSRMEADARREVRAWRWELELAVYRKGARIRPLFTFEAVPNQANKQ